MRRGHRVACVGLIAVALLGTACGDDGDGFSGGNSEESDDTDADTDTEVDSPDDTAAATATSAPVDDTETSDELDGILAYDYEVTMVNLTQGQPLSPPVIATHRGDGVVWKLSLEASNGVVQIAENGNNGPLLTELSGLRADGSVFEFRQAGLTPLAPAGSPGAATDAAAPCVGGCPDRVTVRIYAPADDPRLSWVSMLVCTNDGFTGVNGIALPTEIGEEVVFEAAAYETSTEMNTEVLADIMPPCQGIIGIASPSGAPGTAQSNPDLAESGTIVPHRGIIGNAELQAGVHGWGEPAAKLIVTRVG